MSHTVGNSEDRTNEGEQWLDSIGRSKSTQTWMLSQIEVDKSLGNVLLTGKSRTIAFLLRLEFS
ncbi:hypothetical protein [Vibrio rotiferianus]|nr:hypothetical protein [Vibrio rotiferianus]